MATFKRATAKTVAAIVRRLADQIEADAKASKEAGKAWARDDDTFGPEGQFDPRGDPR